MARKGGEESCTHGLGWEIRGKETTCKTQAQMGENIEMDLQEIGWWTWNGLIWLRTGTSKGCSKHSNEPSSSKTCKEFDQLNTDFCVRIQLHGFIYLHIYEVDAETKESTRKTEKNGWKV